MKQVTITLSLEDDKFNEMERILLDRGHNRLKATSTENDWTRFVIEMYEDTEPYLDCHNGNLEAAYEDMRYDF